jgi:hypothetical protein
MIELLFKGEIFEWIFQNYLIKSRFGLDECESSFICGKIINNILGMGNLD